MILLAVFLLMYYKTVKRSYLIRFCLRTKDKENVPGINIFKPLRSVQVLYIMVIDYGRCRGIVNTYI